jgi:hypothetical protein
VPLVVSYIHTYIHTNIHTYKHTLECGIGDPLMLASQNLCMSDDDTMNLCCMLYYYIMQRTYETIDWSKFESLYVPDEDDEDEDEDDEDDE